MLTLIKIREKSEEGHISGKERKLYEIHEVKKIDFEIVKIFYSKTESR